MAMSAERDDMLPHLHGSAALLAAASADPRRLSWILLIGMVVVAWTYLSILSIAAGLGGSFSALGPGMSRFDRILEWSGLGSLAFPVIASNDWLARLIAVCATTPSGWSATTAILHVTMWLAMAVAMMLPSAAPMLRTYSEIADTAASVDRRIVSPFVLAAGYLSVWTSFAVLAAMLQWGLGHTGALSGNGLVASDMVAIGILAVAGLYQFTGQKAACLVKCANPFPYLFVNWTERPVGVFLLGVRQGLYCLACCWALMLVMFAVGTMNLVWIAVLTLVVTTEKLVGKRVFSGTIGLALIVWAALVALSLPVG